MPTLGERAQTILDRINAGTTDEARVEAECLVADLDVMGIGMFGITYRDEAEGETPGGDGWDEPVTDEQMVGAFGADGGMETAP